MKSLAGPPGARVMRGLTERFVFAVRTTGVYCRPSCPARRPLRTNAECSAGGAAAHAAGYRACKRCKPDGASTEAELGGARRCGVPHDQSRANALTLADLAALAGESSCCCQRTFRRIVGSPRPLSGRGAE